MSTYCNYWNKVSLVRSKIKKSKKIDSIGIGLASPEEIRRWGERRLPNGTLIGKVDKDHTVDYESLKPIEGGLFCERIFGPVEDFYCSCERKGEKNEKFCPNCEVEFTKSRVRRIRMGYIPLAVPVVHVWYLRGRPSYIANLVGKSRNSIDRLAYGETLSESFIGSSSLESIYKRGENFFPKRLLYAKDLFTPLCATKQRSWTQTLCHKGIHYPYPIPRRGKATQAPSGYGACVAEGSGGKASATELSSAYPEGVKLRTPLANSFQRRGSQLAKLNFVRTLRSKASECSPPRLASLGRASLLCLEGRQSREICGSKAPPLANSFQLKGLRSFTPYPFTPSGYEACVAEGYGQTYLKCHTLPLFSTFVYKEWSHRFSFLEYFIWSARKNDLLLPFYAYQNSRSERRFTNICESIRKNSINLIVNKLSLQFSNKSNLSLKASISPATQAPKGERGIPPRLAAKGPRAKERGSKPLSNSFQPNPSVAKRLSSASRLKNYNNKTLVLQEQEVQPSFLQLRNKEGVLRSLKVTQNKGHTKPNFCVSFSPGLCYASPSYAQMNISFHTLFTPSGYGLTKQQFDYPSPHTPYPFTPYPFPPYPEGGKGYGGKGYGVHYPNKFISAQPARQRSTRKPLATPFGHKRGLRSWENIEGAPANSFQSNFAEAPLNKMDTQQFPRLTELLNFTGGAALRNLLSRFDLIILSRFLRHELKNLELKVNSLLALKILTYSQGLLLGKLAKRRSKQIRRLKLLELFQSQKSNPEWMILSVIPVLPPDLRPILRVNDDFVVASDLNRLYQTVLRRNNTIHERLDDPLPCPESGLFRQRSLQKAVDGLLENGKGGGTPLCASKRRPLVSLSHVLKGKKGLFRQHLLGKRVDYSGRSVIVVGPKLQLHECGLPKEMAIELFQPFLLHRLKVKGFATSNTTARQMIHQENPVIWHTLKELVYEHPVLLNRAPTLHRLGIQAFQPRLVSGRAILLHPLVCNGFNADFDGDQMAVHVPLSFQARAEAWKIMWSKNNFLSPATGQPILVPSQDMVLGCYYLSVSIPRILNANVSVVSHELQNEVAKSFTGLPDSLTKKRFTTKELCYSKEVSSPQRSETQTSYASPLPHSSAAELFAPYPSATQAPSGYGVKGYTEGACVAGGLPYKAGWGYIKGMPLCFARGSDKFPLKKGLQNKAFLNENKGQYFSNLQDSLLAYFQGRLQTHTPFWVRIDPVSFKDITSNALLSYASPLPHSSAAELLTPYPSATQAPSGYGVKGYTEGACVAGGMGSRLSTEGACVALPHTPKGERGMGLPCKAGWKYSKVGYDLSTESIDLKGGETQLGKPFRGKEVTFLEPLYGSSREMCKILFQNKSTNHFQIRIEANETLESPLELRLSVDGNLANIFTMFQNHYNYKATWVKQCKEESRKYMRTTAGRVVINGAVFKDF